jgi:hypothetical protein
VKTVLGSHNVPIAPPSVLADLVAAFADLRARKAMCAPDPPGKQRCSIRNFTFLIRQ